MSNAASRHSAYKDSDWDPIMPEQVPYQVHWKPEHSLVWALIEDARKTLTSPIRHSLDDRLNARRWIESDSDKPYSYEWCCIHLGIPPEAIRRQVAAVDSARPVMPDLPLFAYGATAFGQGSSRKTA